MSSAMSGHSGIAAALVKGGLSMGAPAVDVDMLSTASRPSSKRSPFLSRGNGDSAILDEETSEFDFDSDGSDLDGSLPVTGFAVASHRRQVEFHAMFPSIDEGDYLIEGESVSEELSDNLRLWLCIVKGYPSARQTIRLGECSVFPRKHLWMGDRREWNKSVAR